MKTDKEQSYITFAGCDIKNVFQNQTIKDIKPISVDITRERAGVYTIMQFDREGILKSLREPTPEDLDLTE